MLFKYGHGFAHDFFFFFSFLFLYMRIDPPHFLLHTLGYVGHWFVGPRRYL